MKTPLLQRKKSEEKQKGNYFVPVLLCTIFFLLCFIGISHKIFHGNEAQIGQTIDGVTLMESCKTFCTEQQYTAKDGLEDIQCSDLAKGCSRNFCCNEGQEESLEQRRPQYQVNGKYPGGQSKGKTEEKGVYEPYDPCGCVSEWSWEGKTYNRCSLVDGREWCEVNGPECAEAYRGKTDPKILWKYCKIHRDFKTNEAPPPARRHERAREPEQQEEEESEPEQKEEESEEEDGDPCQCMDEWMYQGKRYKNCNYAGTDREWCYVDGREECKESYQSKSEPKLYWRYCYSAPPQEEPQIQKPPVVQQIIHHSSAPLRPCGCKPSWTYEGQSYEGCCKADGSSRSWCYTIGGGECDSSFESKVSPSLYWRYCDEAASLVPSGSSPMIPVINGNPSMIQMLEPRGAAPRTIQVLEPASQSPILPDPTSDLPPFLSSPLDMINDLLGAGGVPPPPPIVQMPPPIQIVKPDEPPRINMPPPIQMVKPDEPPMNKGEPKVKYPEKQKIAAEPNPGHKIAVEPESTPQPILPINSLPQSYIMHRIISNPDLHPPPAPPKVIHVVHPIPETTTTTTTTEEPHVEPPHIPSPIFEPPTIVTLKPILETMKEYLKDGGKGKADSSTRSRIKDAVIREPIVSHIHGMGDVNVIHHHHVILPPVAPPPPPPIPETQIVKVIHHAPPPQPPPPPPKQIVKVIHVIDTPAPTPPPPPPKQVVKVVHVYETQAPAPQTTSTAVEKPKETQIEGWDIHAKNFNCNPTDFVEGKPKDNSLDECIKSCEALTQLSKGVQYVLHSENQCGIYGKCSTTEPIERTDEPVNIYKKVNTAALATNNGFENVIIQKIPAPVIQSLPTVVQAPPAVVQALPARPPSVVQAIPAQASAVVQAIPAQASAVVQAIPSPVVQIQTSDAPLIQTSSETSETIETSDASEDTTAEPETSDIVAPIETSAAAVAPIETSAAAVVPVETSAAAVVPVETSAAVVVPVETSAAAVVPVETSAAAAIPFETSASAAVPVETSAAAAVPVETSALAVETKTSDIVAPIETSAAAAVPIETSAAAALPVETSAPAAETSSTVSELSLSDESLLDNDPLERLETRVGEASPPRRLLEPRLGQTSDQIDPPKTPAAPAAPAIPIPPGSVMSVLAATGVQGSATAQKLKPQEDAPSAHSRDCTKYDLSKPILAPNHAPLDHPIHFIMCYAQSFAHAPGELEKLDYWVKLIHHTDYDVMVHFGPKKSERKDPTQTKQWRQLEAMVKTGHFRTQYEQGNGVGTAKMKGGFRPTNYAPLSDPVPGNDEWPSEYRRDDFERLIYAYSPEMLPRPTYGFLNHKKSDLGLDTKYGLFLLVIDRREISNFATGMYGDGMRSMIDLVESGVTDQSKLASKMHNRIGALNDPLELVHKVNAYHWEWLSKNPDRLGNEQHVEVHIHKTIFLLDPVVKEIRVKCMNSEKDKAYQEEYIHTALVCFFQKFQSKIVLYEVGETEKEKEEDGDQQKSPEEEQELVRRKGMLTQLAQADPEFQCFNHKIGEILSDTKVQCPQKSVNTVP